MNTPTPDDLPIRVREAIFAGNKIEAIKLHREQTGLGLKESKEAVEKMEAELRISSPTQFSKPPGKGCLSILIVTGAIAVGWILA